MTRTVTRTYVTTGNREGRTVTAGGRLDGSTLILNGIKRPVRGWFRTLNLLANCLVRRPGVRQSFLDPSIIRDATRQGC